VADAGKSHDAGAKTAGTASDATRYSSAGPKGAALAPPDYGIHWVDSLTASAPLQRVRASDAGHLPSHAGYRPQQSIRAFAGESTVQRMVRIDGGAKKVDEQAYQDHGAKANVGKKVPVATLMADEHRRVFFDVAELEAYADGNTDYIGDVATTTKGTFWYRLPKDKLTVLGEEHGSPEGNVEDAIVGLGTSRFKLEAFGELPAAGGLNIDFKGTRTSMDAATRVRRVAGLVDTDNFPPALENIVIKVLAGVSFVRNGFIAGNPKTMKSKAQKAWGSREKHGRSGGERAAQYLSTAIHLAADLAGHDFGKEAESELVKSARAVSACYGKYKAVLDDFMKNKDADPLIGIYELTAPEDFKNLDAIKDFTLAMHVYASRYTEQLGIDTGNEGLQKEGQTVLANTGATLETLSPAREQIMWKNILLAQANNYLIVGMGDEHRINLEAKLNTQGIAHEKVSDALARQSGDIESKWAK
jgi:hypothetical protein